MINPYLAGGLFVDYLVRGRYHLIPKHPEILGPDNLIRIDSARLRPMRIRPARCRIVPRPRVEARRFAGDDAERFSERATCRRKPIPA